MAGLATRQTFALVLTHDVEGSKGASRVDQRMNLELKQGFRSCFNFVPEDEYRVPDSLRETLDQAGFEVSVHGLEHDGKLYSSKAKFVAKASRIKEYLQRWNSSRFRSPLMQHKLDWLQIRLEPNQVNTAGTILAFYWPASRTVPFVMRQSLGDLKLERAIQDQSAKKPKIYIEDVFSQPKPVFVAISSGETGTVIYVDGILVKKSSNFSFSSHELTGQFILGNAPETTDSWSGQVRGLAVYDRELTAAEVAQHFGKWTAGGKTNKQRELFQSEGGVCPLSLQ
jgi:Concanavalin A-like lectin/glucanases superfamily